jgi:hypothetical protein
MMTVSLLHKKSHGKDGRYLVLVVGPFANLSDDFMVLCDFLGRVRAFRAINKWNINPKHALAINRHILITRFGHLAALMWARLILSRFRDAVLPDSTFASADSGAYFNAFTPLPLAPLVGYIRADMFQGLRLFTSIAFF